MRPLRESEREVEEEEEEKGQRGGPVGHIGGRGGGGTAKVGNDHTGIYTFRDSRSLPFHVSLSHFLAHTRTTTLHAPRRAWPGRLGPGLDPSRRALDTKVFERANLCAKSSSLKRAAFRTGPTNP